MGEDGGGGPEDRKPPPELVAVGAVRTGGVIGDHMDEVGAVAIGHGGAPCGEGAGGGGGPPPGPVPPPGGARRGWGGPPLPGGRRGSAAGHPEGLGPERSEGA